MGIDAESKECLENIMKLTWAKQHKIAGVRTVLIVLSESFLPFDTDSLRQKVLNSYPDATVFFYSTRGKPLGVHPPEKIDLLIDFTGPHQYQPFLLPRMFRKMARVAVGRKTGWLRNKFYDTVLDENAEPNLSPDPQIRELETQKKLLGLAGVLNNHSGIALPDRGTITPRELPPLQRSPSLL